MEFSIFESKFEQDYQVSRIILPRAKFFPTNITKKFIFRSMGLFAVQE